MPAPTDALLSAPLVRVALCLWLDIGGVPMRFSLAPVAGLAMPATSILADPDPDFDGQAFTALDPAVVSVSTVSHGPGGVEAVQFVLSGTLALDGALLAALSDPAMFRGRLAKLWMVRLDAGFAPTHARPFYAGYMAVPRFAMHPAGDDGAATQTVVIETENYLAMIGGGAPSRSLLWTPDPCDHAADATTGAAGASAALGPNFGGARPDALNSLVQLL